MACNECHASKVKCVKASGSTTCTRCFRLKMECIPHESRQGQGRRKKRRTEKNHSGTSTAAAAAGSVEDQVVSASALNLGPSHFGLHFVVRHWVSYAITRRSFGLLNKASALALKCGITMDQIISGENDFKPQYAGVHRDMVFLQDVIRKPNRDQEVGGGVLEFSEVPAELCQAINCSTSSHLPRRDPDKRWIWIRELKLGTSRFYASEAFQRDIQSFTSMSETWRRNKGEVADLWTPKPERIKYAQALSQQFAVHKKPGMGPAPTRTPTTKLLLGSGTIVDDIECVVCLHLINLDHAYISVEYFQPPARTTDTMEDASSSDNQNNNKKKNPRQETISYDDLAFFENLDPFEWTGELDDLFNSIQ